MADPYTLMGIFHVAYVLAIVMSLVCGVLGLGGRTGGVRKFEIGPRNADCRQFVVAFGIAGGNCTRSVYTLIASASVLSSQGKDSKPRKRLRQGGVFSADRNGLIQRAASDTSRAGRRSAEKARARR